MAETRPEAAEAFQMSQAGSAQNHMQALETVQDLADCIAGQSGWSEVLRAACSHCT